LLASLAVVACASRSVPEAPAEPTATAAASSEKHASADPATSAPTAVCPYPLFLESVTPVAGPAVVASEQSEDLVLTVSRLDDEATRRGPPSGRKARYGLRLERDGRTVREFVLGRDTDANRPPTVAPGPNGEFLVAWLDRSERAALVGVSSQASFRVLDEAHIARITRDTERIESVLVRNDPLPHSGRALGWAETEVDRFFALRVTFFGKRYQVLTEDRAGLTLWNVEHRGQLSDPRRIDPKGHSAVWSVAADGRAALAYKRLPQSNGSVAEGSPRVVLLELADEDVRDGQTTATAKLGAVGASMVVSSDFLPLAMVSDVEHWWLVGASGSKFTSEDALALFYGEGDPREGRFLRFGQLPTRLELPIDAPPPELVDGAATSERLARVWTLDSVRSTKPGELRGALTREQGDRLEFVVSKRCETPRARQCTGKVVARGRGAIGPLPFRGGMIRVRISKDGAFLERIDDKGDLVWSNETYYPEGIWPSADGSKVFAIRGYGRFEVLSTEDGGELFSQKIPGAAPCLAEVDGRVVLGWRQGPLYTFVSFDAAFDETRILELRGSYEECAIAPWPRGILVATVYDNQPGSNLGARVMEWQRLNPRYYTRIAPYGWSGKLLGVPAAMPGQQPVGWRELGDDARGQTRFVTTLGQQNFEWVWNDTGQVEGKPNTVELPYGGGPRPIDLQRPTWEVWSGEDRSCDAVRHEAR
jgi:hypothetical protein